MTFLFAENCHLEMALTPRTAPTQIALQEECFPPSKIRSAMGRRNENANKSRQYPIYNWVLPAFLLPILSDRCRNQNFVLLLYGHQPIPRHCCYLNSRNHRIYFRSSLLYNPHPKPTFHPKLVSNCIPVLLMCTLLAEELWGKRFGSVNRCPPSAGVKLSASFGSHCQWFFSVLQTVLFPE